MGRNEILKFYVIVTHHKILLVAVQTGITSKSRMVDRREAAIVKTDSQAYNVEKIFLKHSQIK